MEWNLIFSVETNRGVATDRQPGDGEYLRKLPADQCADFRVTPSRYEWTGVTIREWPGWEAEQAANALDDARSIMVAKITAEEDRVSWLPIESPAESGIFHKITTAITNTIERYRGIQSTDPLPINGGCWDDAGGNPIPFTYGDLVALQQEIYDRAAYNYGVKKYHIAEMTKMATPQNYDYFTGWK